MKIVEPGSHLTAKILSVLFAIVLWLVITLHSTFSYKVTIPIKNPVPSEGFIMTGSIPEKAIVNIRGTGRALLVFSIKRILDHEKHYATVSLAGFTAKGKHLVDLDKNKIYLGENTTLVVENILENAFFSVEIERIDTRSIPVDLDNLPDYTVEKGYILVGKPQAKPGIVVVKGPVDTLETMNTIKISSFPNSKVSVKNPVLQASLGKDLSDFVTTDPETINLHFTIEKLTHKVIAGVPVVLKNFPDGNFPYFVPRFIDVTVEGPESVVSGLASDDVLVTVRYQVFLELSAKGVSIIKPEIKLPESVAAVTVKPDMVRFSADYGDN